MGLPAHENSDILDNDYNPNETSAERLLVTWKRGLKHLDTFWEIWKNDNLLSLRERFKIKLKESPYKASVGDVVLIKDNLPRGTWRIGRTKELIVSRDEQIRSAKVLLLSNKTTGRPIKAKDKGTVERQLDYPGGSVARTSGIIYTCFKFFNLLNVLHLNLQKQHINSKGP